MTDTKHTPGSVEDNYARWWRDAQGDFDDLKTTYLPAGEWGICADGVGLIANVPHLRRMAAERDRLLATQAELLEVLTLALPYVEEGEKFNKPSGPKLSKQIRAAIIRAEGKP